MTALLVPPVEILGVGLLQSLHELAQRCLRTLNQQMNMVGHQTESINDVTVLPTVLRQPFEIGVIVGVGGEGLLSLIAPYNDVVENTGGK